MTQIPVHGPALPVRRIARKPHSMEAVRGSKEVRSPARLAIPCLAVP